MRDADGQTPQHTSERRPDRGAERCRRAACPSRRRPPSTAPRASCGLEPADLRRELPEGEEQHDAQEPLDAAEAADGGGCPAARWAAGRARADGGRGPARGRCRPDRSASRRDRPGGGRRRSLVALLRAAAGRPRRCTWWRTPASRRPSPGSHPRRRTGRRGAAAPSRTSPGRVTKLVPPFCFTSSVARVQGQLVLVDVHRLRDLVGVRRRVREAAHQPRDVVGRAPPTWPCRRARPWWR